MDELQAARRIEELNVLLDVSRELGAGTELSSLLKRVEVAALRVLHCERATVFLYDAGAKELYSKVATGGADIRFPVTVGIAGLAASSGTMVNVPDAYADERFNPEVDRRTGFRTRNLLTFCLHGYDGRMVGVLQALNKKDGAFTSADEGLAGTLSTLAGVAVERQMLLEAYAAKQRMEQDMALAREVQQACLPKSFPQIEGYDVAGWNKPADQTGGDCFDFIPLENGKWAMLIADATGHGIGPALVVSQCRAVLRSLLRKPEDLAGAMARTNRMLYDDMPDERFVTTFCGVIDPQNHRVDYVSAGHGPLLLLRAAGGQRIEEGASTVPMGILPELDTTPAEPFALEQGDTLLLLTDGFFEWANSDGKLFGVQRVFDLVQQNADSSAAELIEQLHREVVRFGENSEQADDLTAIIVKRK